MANGFYEAVPAALQPKFSDGFTLVSVLQPKVFVLLSILATAFCAHFLSPQFLAQLSSTARTRASNHRTSTPPTH